jgi:hypothetical protein
MHITITIILLILSDDHFTYHCVIWVCQLSKLKIANKNLDFTKFWISPHPVVMSGVLLRGEHLKATALDTSCFGLGHEPGPRLLVRVSIVDDYTALGSKRRLEHLQTLAGRLEFIHVDVGIRWQVQASEVAFA